MRDRDLKRYNASLMLSVVATALWSGTLAVVLSDIIDSYGLQGTQEPAGQVEVLVLIEGPHCRLERLGSHEAVSLRDGVATLEVSGPVRGSGPGPGGRVPVHVHNAELSIVPSVVAADHFLERSLGAIPCRYQRQAVQGKVGIYRGLRGRRSDTGLGVRDEFSDTEHRCDSSDTDLSGGGIIGTDGKGQGTVLRLGSYGSENAKRISLTSPPASRANHIVILVMRIGHRCDVY